MAAANVTCPGSAAREIEADGSEYTATLNKPGGRLRAKAGFANVWVNLNGGTVDATDGSASSVEVVAGEEPIDIPVNCLTFTFKTEGAAGYLVYDPS